jgi:hypothetical protein
MYFSPVRRDLAERYATDPDYRASRITKKLWEKNAPPIRAGRSLR